MTDATDDLAARTLTAAQRHDALPEDERLVLPKLDWQGVEQYRPTPMPAAAKTGGNDANAPLPQADIVVMTWTIAEWAALDHVFCDYDREMTLTDARGHEWRDGWQPYSRGYYAIRQYMEDVYKTYQGGAPSLPDESWGQFRMVGINGLRVLLVKSAMHLAQDGTGLPLRKFVARICEEAAPKLLLSIGTAGGVREEDALGCALITNQACFHLIKEFSNAEFNATTVQSQWTPKTQLLAEAQARALQVPGYPLYPVSPQYPEGSRIAPDTPDSRLKVVTEAPIITTDAFLFGTTRNELQQYGCIVEMDDAVVGMTCREKAIPFGFVRNVSDPVIDARLPKEVQNAWAGYIYQERGLFTSYNGALAAWALIAGESDAHAIG